MAYVENTELLESKLGRWNPGDLAIIMDLKFSTRKENSDSEIIIEALFQKKEKTQISWPSNKQQWYSACIQFIGVKNFNIKNFNGSPQQIMGFDITDISDQGWEMSNFHIEDYENGLIDFYCKKIRIISFEEDYYFKI